MVPHTRPQRWSRVYEHAPNLARFAGTTPLSRAPAFAGAGPCLERTTPCGRRQASGLYGFRSSRARKHSATAVACAHMRVATSPLRWASSSASLGTAQSIPQLCCRSRRWVGAALASCATAVARVAVARRGGSQGVCRNSCLARMRAGVARPQRWSSRRLHCGGAHPSE
jgi:hypothetical protein